MTLGLSPSLFPAWGVLLPAVPVGLAARLPDAARAALRFSFQKDSQRFYDSFISLTGSGTLRNAIQFGLLK
jgi:hypothetical protein